jgi:four helix bundle protein
MARGVKRFTELRAWQACDIYKKAIYLLCDNEPITRDFGRRKQLEESASRSTAHIAEGFGRFNPADFARFCVIARSSLMESQNHLRNFVDKEYISEERRSASRPERQARHTERRTSDEERRTRKDEPRTENKEGRTEPETEDEPRSENSEG